MVITKLTSHLHISFPHSKNLPRPKYCFSEIALAVTYVYVWNCQGSVCRVCPIASHWPKSWQETWSFQAIHISVCPSANSLRFDVMRLFNNELLPKVTVIVTSTSSNPCKLICHGNVTPHNLSLTAVNSVCSLSLSHMIAGQQNTAKQGRRRKHSLLQKKWVSGWVRVNNLSMFSFFVSDKLVCSLAALF